MQTLSDRLRYALYLRGKVAADLARACGVKPPSVSSWMSGKTKTVSPTYLEAAAKYLLVDYNWLASGTGDEPQVEGSAFTGATSTSNVKSCEFQGAIPLLSTVQAGQFCEAESRDYSSAEEWLPRMPGHGPNTFAMRVDGDSMTSPYPGAKSYPHGTIIYVDPDFEPRNGSAVVVKTTDSHEITFKLLMRDAGKTYLKPINPQYQMIEVENVHICGVVRGSYTPE